MAGLLFVSQRKWEVFVHGAAGEPRIFEPLDALWILFREVECFLGIRFYVIELPVFWFFGFYPESDGFPFAVADGDDATVAVEFPKHWFIADSYWLARKGRNEIDAVRFINIAACNVSESGEPVRKVTDRVVTGTSLDVAFPAHDHGNAKATFVS